MIIDSIDSLHLNQHSYLQLMNEIEVIKIKALNKLKKEDENVKKFIESKLYLVLKSNLIKTSNKYNYYLSTVENYEDVILEEVFDILMKEGK